MAKDYAKLAREVVSLVGGAENIQSLSHCITRLRFVLKDESRADTDAVNQTEGVLQVIRANGQYQVVIGTHVKDVYRSVIDQKLVPAEGTESPGSQDGEKKKVSVLDVISGSFMPILGGMMATGILKGFLVMLTTLGVMSNTSDTYTVLYAAADAFFYFLPLALAITAARKFECNQFVAFAIIAALVYPNLVTAMGAEGGLHFLGLPVTNVSYSNSVIPALVSVWVLSKLEKFLNKIFPEIVQSIFVPLICLLIMFPVTLIAIGPVMTWAGELVAAGYMFLYGLCPPLAGMIIAGLWPLLVIVGAHTATIPIAMNNMAVNGADTLLPVTTGTNFAITGAALAVALKTKNQDLKKLGFTTAFSAFVGGVTEPAIYGIVLKYKKPFYICMISTAIGGLVAGLAGSAFPAFITTCVITLPAMAMFPGGWGFVAASAIGFLGGLIGTFLFGFDDSMIIEK